MRDRTARSRTAPAARAAVLLAVLQGTPAPASAEPARWGADYFPNVELLTHEGAKVRLYDDLLKDKIVAIDLVYTRCKFACPLETARLAQVQRLLGDRVGKDIFFYSLSMDPEHDRPEVLKAYAQKFGAGPGWLFLTGTKDDVKLVAAKLGLRFEPAVNRDGHTPDLMIGNVATGQWMKNSAVDNPRFLATMIGNFLDGYRRRDQVGRSYAEVSGAPLDRGRYLFASRCSACHTVGQGDRVGPDLKGVTTARDRGWLARYIAAPDEALARGDPLATELYARYGRVPMPNLRLGSDEIAAVLDYLDEQARAP